MSSFSTTVGEGLSRQGRLKSDLLSYGVVDGRTTETSSPRLLSTKTESRVVPDSLFGFLYLCSSLVLSSVSPSSHRL